MRVQPIINFPVSLGSYSDFISEITCLSRKRKSCYVCVAAVHQLVEAFRSPSFASVVRGAEIITPDGMPITWGLRFLFKIRQARIAGMDILPDLIERASRENLSVYFYGSTDAVLEKTRIYLSTRYPNLLIAGMYSPPFRNLTSEEEEEIVKKVNTSNANLVFVILGCPKQEKWMANMKDRIQATMVGIGAALPVMVGLQRRAPGWMQRSGLEWFFRLTQEPKRLWKRYFVSNSLFLVLLACEKIRMLIPRMKRSNETSFPIEVYGNED